MVSYCTPERYRTFGTGMDLSAFDDVELDSILAGASSRVNAICAAPNLPSPHDFRGGTVVGERHRWYLGNETIAASRRFYPSHTPLIALSRVRIYVSSDSYVEINPADTITSPFDNWVEVVALTLGIGVFPVVSNLIGTQPLVDLNYTYGRSYPVVGEVLRETDGQTFRAQNQWWHTTPAPVIYIDGVDSTGDFTIDSSEGTVTHDGTELAAGQVVTADYSHKLPFAIMRATALLATEAIGQSRIAARGLVGVGRIRVAEVEITRPFGSVSARGGSSESLAEVDQLLTPYKFISVAGY